MLAKLFKYDDEHQLIPQPPWPRSWYNYPIILCGICIQYVWAITIFLDSQVLNVTGLHPLLLYVHVHAGDLLNANHGSELFIRASLIFILMCTATASIIGFFLRKKMHTLLCFIPQQFVMCLSTFGVVRAMISGQFADGVARTPAFLIADQCTILLLTIFHTWAMILILIHAKDD